MRKPSSTDYITMTKVLLCYHSFSSSVLDIKASGIMTKWWKELTVKKKDCNVLETAPIILKTVLTPFLLLAVASAVSLCVMLLERRLFLCRNYQRMAKPFQPL